MLSDHYRNHETHSNSHLYLASFIQANIPPQQIHLLFVKDTITTDEKNDEVQADYHSYVIDSTIGFNAIVHHFIPILTSQDLQIALIKH